MAVCDLSTYCIHQHAPLAAIWQTGNADGGWVGYPDPALSTASIAIDTTGQFCLPFIGCFPLSGGSAGWSGGSQRPGLASRWRQR